MGFYDKLQQIAGKVITKFGTDKLKVVSDTRSYATTGVFGDLSFTDKMDTAITAGSQQILLSGNVPFVPKVGDFVERQGVRWVISRVDTTNPADVNVIHTLIVNK